MPLPPADSHLTPNQRVWINFVKIVLDENGYQQTSPGPNTKNGEYYQIHVSLSFMNHSGVSGVITISDDTIVNVLILGTRELIDLLNPDSIAKLLTAISKSRSPGTSIIAAMVEYYLDSGYQIDYDSPDRFAKKQTIFHIDHTYFTFNNSLGQPCTAEVRWPENDVVVHRDHSVGRTFLVADPGFFDHVLSFCEGREHGDSIRS